jgi:DNA-binding MarR family transcriptional regulator
MTDSTSGSDVAARLAAALERIGEAARILLRSAAAAEGLSPTQAQVLLRLHQSRAEPGQHGTVALARWLGVSAPTVSDAVAALERKRLVSRRAPGSDLRRVSVGLTAGGSAAAGRLADWDEPLRTAVVGADAGLLASGSLGGLLELALRTIAELQRAGVVTIARTCTACRFFQPTADGGEPYWCGLLQAPLAPDTLRLDCPDHQSA